MELLDPTKWIPALKDAATNILATHKVTVRIVGDAVEVTFDPRTDQKEAGK